jgi:hypothetical protein
MGQALFVAKKIGDGVTEYRSRQTGRRYELTLNGSEATVRGDTFALISAQSRADAISLIELADKHTG